MAISLFIEFGGQVVQLPVNPPELDIKRSNEDEVFEVLKLGEVSEFGYTTLATTAIDCFFPATKGPSYIMTNGKFWAPQKYIDFLNKVMTSKKPCRFIVSDTKINFLATITEFVYGPRSGTNDITYTLELREYKEHSAQFVKIVKQKVTSPKKQTTTPKKQTGSTNKAITVGCEVIVNGRLHLDSYGRGPGQTEKNARRILNFIAKGRKCPYHVRILGKDNSQRAWRGWVTAGSVRRV